MSKATTNEDRNKQNALIGEFLIQFEHICSMIRLSILRICYPTYTNVQYNNIETLLEGITADPVRRKYVALVYDNFENNTDLQKLSKKVSTEFAHLIKARNSIAHGSIIRNHISGTFSIKHPKSTNTGINRNSILVENKTIELLIKQTSYVSYCYENMYIIMDKSLPDDEKTEFYNNIRNMLSEIGSINLDYSTKISK